MLRDVFESLKCFLDHWLSCILDCIHVYVFLLLKNCFEKLARHLLDSQLSVELSKLFLIAILIAPRYLVDRSRKFLTSRQLLDTWWINRASYLASSVFILDSFSTHNLSTLLFSTPARQISRHLICRDLLMVYIFLLVRSAILFCRSLS